MSSFTYELRILVIWSSQKDSSHMSLKIKCFHFAHMPQQIRIEPPELPPSEKAVSEIKPSTSRTGRTIRVSEIKSSTSRTGQTIRDGVFGQRAARILSAPDPPPNRNRQLSPQSCSSCLWCVFRHQQWHLHPLFPSPTVSTCGRSSLVRSHMLLLSDSMVNLASQGYDKAPLIQPQVKAPHACPRPRMYVPHPTPEK